eukprot:3950737-Lingulodinium_polyedra.AAC.1
MVGSIVPGDLSGRRGLGEGSLQRREGALPGVRPEGMDLDPPVRSRGGVLCGGVRAGAASHPRPRGLLSHGPPLEAPGRHVRHARGQVEVVRTRAQRPGHALAPVLRTNPADGIPDGVPDHHGQR